MKKLITFIIFMSIVTFTFAQSTVTGRLVDETTNEPLIGATVRCGDAATVTDLDGNFTLNNVPNGNQTIVAEYLGYQPLEQAVNASGATNLGRMALASSAIGMEEINVVASVAIDRKTPVAVSTIKAEIIENKIGNQEFPEILKTTPSIYTTKSGGGYGDGRINVRGFDQRNTAVLINGIPVNDMENGWVYWSNWAGLSDVTRTVQVQRGLGASKLAISSIGGTVNLITKTTDMVGGASAFSTIGNDGFFKAGLTLSTGRQPGGWAATFSGSRTTGDGYIDATFIDAWSYFGSLSKEFGDDHQLVFTAIGAPQRHGQRSFTERLSVYDERGQRYNSDWGMRDGEAFNIRENFYHKPQMALNHYWNITDKAFLATSAYLSFGRGGGSGDRGSIGGRGTWGYRADDGTILVDDIIAWNTGTDNLGVEGVGTNNIAGVGNVVGEQYGLIKRGSMNEHNWVGALSTLNVDLSDKLNLIAGVDLRRYKGLHYRRIMDLMGADYWVDSRDVNAPETGYDLNGDGEISSRERGKLVQVDEGDFNGTPEEARIHYDNDGIVGWQGVFGQLEYELENGLTIFGAVSGSNTSYKRVDRFNYEPSENTSDTYNFLGYNGKAGANYNINSQHNVFVNAGYYSRAPFFDAVFPNFTNDANADAKNEKTIGLELGYGLRMSKVSANVNFYNTMWQDKFLYSRFFDDNGNPIRANVTGLDAIHRGIELDVNVSPVEGLSLRGMASFGDWKWVNDVEADVFDDNDMLIGTVAVYSEGLRVGDAAQTTFGLGADYRLPFGLGIDFDYIYYDNLYAEFDPSDRDDIALRGVQAVQLPSYGLLDGGLTYKIDINDQLGAKIRFNMNNMLDTEYIAETFDRISYDDNDVLLDNQGRLDNSSGFYGFGRTWNIGLKVFWKK